MTRNPGRCPLAAQGKRVRGTLANGRRFGDVQVTPVAPLGWASDGRQGCRWTLTGSPFDLAEYEVIGMDTEATPITPQAEAA